MELNLTMSLEIFRIRQAGTHHIFPCHAQLKEVRKNFRTAPYLIMHVHLTGDTLNNKAPYMDV